jgi:hypothetical protein
VRNTLLRRRAPSRTRTASCRGAAVENNKKCFNNNDYDGEKLKLKSPSINEERPVY